MERGNTAQRGSSRSGGRSGIWSTRWRYGRGRGLLPGGGSMKTVFLRALDAVDKKEVLLNAVRSENADNAIVYMVDPRLFSKVPKSPFAYWISDEVRELFVTLPPVESEGRVAGQGGVNGDDSRWLRLWTEPLASHGEYKWVPIAKGG